MLPSTALSDAGAPRWRLVALAGGVAGYAVLSYLLMSRWPSQPWAVALLFGPPLSGLAAVGLVRRHGPTLLASAVLLAVLVAVVARGDIDIEYLYVLQHASLHAMLAFGFAITLRPRATPLITMLAEGIHRSLTTDMRAYTRRLTLAWALYFVAMIVVSALTYALAPWAWWTVFCNLVTPVAAVLFFVGEHFWRYARHPEFERATLAESLAAYRRLRR